MAYTLYMYKEFPSISGKTVRLEIFERDFAGVALEIEAMSKAPVFLTADNMNNQVFQPVVKTYLSMSIVDTGQIDYSIFFTPDATKFKVIIKVAGTTEWSGYLTPDSFSQPLAYKGVINLTARDNLGMLSEFPFDNFVSTATIQSTLDAAFTKIGFLCTVEYRTIKLDSAEANILTGLLPLRGLAENNYYEVVEKILNGIGCQLRYVGGNKYAIFDIGDLKGYGAALAAQNFIFIEKSGIKELIPAWKEIKVSQTYNINTQIYEGVLDEASLVYSGTRDIKTELDFVAPYLTVPVRFYTPLGNGWGGTLPIASPYDFTNVSPETILLPLEEFDFPTFRPSIIYSKVIPPYDNGLSINLSVHNAYAMPDYDLYQEGKMVLVDSTKATDTHRQTSGITLVYNVFLEVGATTYILKDKWEEFTGTLFYNYFLVEQPFITQETEGYVCKTSDVALEINIATLKTGGTLYFHLYGFEPYGTLADHDYYDFLCAVKNISFEVQAIDISGRETTAVIDANYNIGGAVNLEIGEVPTGTMNNLVNVGGIFKNTTLYPPMTGFHRTGGTTYHLSELIGREVVHHYKTQKTKLLGSVIVDDNYSAIPHFGKVWTDGTLFYSLNYGSLDFANEVMQVELIEVEAYETEDFTFIEAAIDGGGGTSLGSGSTEFLQWSAAGNATRIYSLATATEAEQGGAYVVIDKSGMASAKKVALLDLLVDAYTKTESDAKYALVAGDILKPFSTSKLTATTLLIPQVASTLASGEIGLYALESGFTGETPSGAGSVTSVGLSMPTGFSVASSPITESGTLAVTFTSGYSLPTTTKQADWDTAFGWGNHAGLYLAVALKGSVNGLAELDANGFVKNTQLPSYVDDVIEAANFAALPVTGESGKIYVTLDTNKTYRWGGTAYAEISESLALGETSSTAYSGDRGKTAYDHTSLTNNPHSVTAAQVGALGVNAKAADSELLDGYNSSVFGGYVSGVADIHAIGGQNLYTFFSSAVNPTNSPSGSDTWVQGIQFPLAQNSDYRQLIASNISDLYYGNEANTNWSWRKLWDSGNSNTTSVNWSAAKLTSTTLIIPTSATLASGEVGIYTTESGFSGVTPSGAGTMTSISMTVPLGLAVTPATITESGTFAISFASGYSLPSDTTQAGWTAKQAALNGTGFVKISGTTISYDNSTYVTGTPWTSVGYYIGDGSAFAAASHAHGNITNDGKIGTTTDLPIITSTGGTLVAKAAGLATQYLNGLGAWGTPPDTIYTHPTTAGNKHIPSGGAASDILIYSADGTAVWGANNYSLTKEGIEGVLTGTITSHNHTGTYALIGGATSQDFSVKVLTMNGDLTGATNGTFSSLLTANQLTTSMSTSNTIMSNLGYYGKDGYWGFRSDTNNNFNLDVYGNGSLINAIKVLQSTGATTFASSVTMLENINTNFRIPKVAPTSPVSDEYYLYIVV